MRPIIAGFVIFALLSVLPAAAQGAGIQARHDSVEAHRIVYLNVAVWRSSQSAPAPLIVFSHGYRGCNTQSSFLMEGLARSGYLVVAPNHSDASCETRNAFTRPEEVFRNPAAWNDGTCKNRGDDIVRLLDALRKDPAWTAQIDWSRVGLAGQSLGGYTVLGLAGGWPTWKLPSAKAVLALSPYCDPFALNGDLGSIEIPAMYQGGTRDRGITPTVKRSGGCYAKMSSPAYFVEFRGAGHFAWTGLADAHHDPITNYSVLFFDKDLRNSPGTGLTSRRRGVSDLKAK